MVTSKTHNSLCLSLQEDRNVLAKLDYWRSLPSTQSSKDPVKADNWRAKGNQEYKQKQLQTACKHYSRSLLFASDSTSRSIALSNRSAALFEMGEYSLALGDIEAALAEGFADKLKLMRRRMLCFQKTLTESRCRQIPSSVTKVIKSFIMDDVKKALVGAIAEYEKQAELTKDSAMIRRAKQDVEKWEVFIKCQHPFLDELDEGSRVVIRTFWLLQLANASDVPLEAPEFGTLSDYTQNDARAFWSLKDHNTERSENEIQEMGMKAYLIVRHLGLPMEVMETLMVIGGILSCNSFTVKTKETSGGVGDVQTEKEERLGTALYTNVSLINHSCVPNSVVEFSGNEITLKATSPLKKEAELTISYGPTAARMSCALRKQTTKQKWYFECSCAACVSDGSNDLQSRYMKAFKCSNAICSFPIIETDAKCPKCGSATGMQSKIPALYQQSTLMLETLAASPPQAALVILQSVLSVRRKICHPLSHAMAEVLDQIAYNNAQLGDFDTAAQNLQQTIPIIETIFGERSIELARELFKLSTLLFNTKRRMPAAINIIERAIELHQLLNLEKDDLAELRKIRAGMT
ncbi:SET and MYND domain-containing protein 4 [Chytridiales sp. JEL 0842]|nr:SET and MYND domain-containing protein 4 [Chytridiales sp. JEL 0842]